MFPFSILKTLLTRDFEVGPFLRRSTEVVNILEEITAAGHDKLITALFCVAAGVEFNRQVDGSGDVHFVLKRKVMDVTLVSKLN